MRDDAENGENEAPVNANLSLDPGQAYILEIVLLLYSAQLASLSYREDSCTDASSTDYICFNCRAPSYSQQKQ